MCNHTGELGYEITTSELDCASELQKQNKTLEDINSGLNKTKSFVLSILNYPIQYFIGHFQFMTKTDELIMSRRLLYIGAITMIFQIFLPLDQLFTDQKAINIFFGQYLAGIVTPLVKRLGLVL